MASEKKFCANCGAPITADLKFCPNCGAALTATPASPTTTEKSVMAKVTQSTTQQADKLAKMATKKTGKSIKPQWIMGAVGAGIVVIAVIIFLLIPKGLHGTYTYHDQHKDLLDGTVNSTETFTFKGDQYTYKDNEKYQDVMGAKTAHTRHEKGTYKLEDQDVTFTSSQGVKSTATLSKDKSHLNFGGSSFAKNN